MQDLFTVVMVSLIALLYIALPVVVGLAALRALINLIFSE
jgi:hypothetical protein